MDLQLAVSRVPDDLNDLKRACVELLIGLLGEEGASARARPSLTAKGRLRVKDEQGEEDIAELGDEVRRRRPLGLGFEAAGSVPSLHVYGSGLRRQQG